MQTEVKKEKENTFFVKKVDVKKRQNFVTRRFDFTLTLIATLIAAFILKISPHFSTSVLLVTKRVC